MKSIIIPVFVLFILLVSQNLFSQTLHNVQVGNFSFTPAQLTINVGDTVKWTNTGGNHNVLADDNSFTSGAPSSLNWVYQFVFHTTGTFPYYCQIHGGPGGTGMSGTIMVNNPTDVKDNNTVYNFELKQNYPNPFNPSTEITYQVAAKTHVTLKIFDVLGNEVTAIVNEDKPAGSYKITWNAANFPSGVYFYRLQAGDFLQMRKMILMK